MRKWTKGPNSATYRSWQCAGKREHPRSCGASPQTATRRGRRVYAIERLALRREECALLRSTIVETTPPAKSSSRRACKNTSALTGTDMKPTLAIVFLMGAVVRSWPDNTVRQKRQDENSIEDTWEVLLPCQSNLADIQPSGEIVGWSQDRPRIKSAESPNRRVHMIQRPLL